MKIRKYNYCFLRWGDVGGSKKQKNKKTAAYCLSLGSKLICRQEEGIILSINMFLDILLGLLCAGVKKIYKKTTWARVEMQ